MHAKHNHRIALLGKKWKHKGKKKKESLAVSPDIAYGGKFLSVYYILISKWLN